MEKTDYAVIKSTKTAAPRSHYARNGFSTSAIGPYPSRRCPIYSPEPYCPFSSSLTSLCTSLSLTNRRRGPTDNRRIKSKTTPLPLGICICGYAPIRRPDARGSENRASADGYKIPQEKIDCGTRLNSADSLPVRADNAERSRGAKPQKSAISYNYNLACKLLPFAAPGDSRLHSLGTILRIRKSPHGDFRKGLFFMEPAKRLELLAC